jgi:hypothetical protein
MHLKLIIYIITNYFLLYVLGPSTRKFEISQEERCTMHCFVASLESAVTASVRSGQVYISVCTLIIWLKVEELK